MNLLDGNHHELITFLHAVTDTVLTQKKPVTLDFRRTESFSPAGTLLLFAELDRVISLSELPKPISCRPPWRLRPREVLKQIGVFALTGDSLDLVPQREDVVFWKATKGKDGSGQVFGPLLEYVAETVDRKATEKLQASELWPGVSEAILNAVEHAYKGDRGDGFPYCPETRWWMFTQVRDGLFYVAVCDLGIGYRRSTPQTIPEAFIRSIAAKLSGNNVDSLAIQAAMEYGVSSTKEEHRGKGSRDALSVLLKHGHGELVILSNTGGAVYGLKEGERQPSLLKVFDLGIRTRSTIVWWRLPISRESEDSDGNHKRSQAIHPLSIGPKIKARDD